MKEYLTQSNYTLSKIIRTGSELEQQNQILRGHFDVFIKHCINKVAQKRDRFV